MTTICLVAAVLSAASGLGGWLYGIADWVRDRYDTVAANGRWQLVLACAGYAALVFLTHRLVVAAPVRLQLAQQIVEQRALVGPRPPQPGQEADLVGPVHHLLDKAERQVTWRAPWRREPQDPEPPRKNQRRHARPFATLAKVLVGLRYVHAAARLQVRGWSAGTRERHAILVEERLRLAGGDEAVRLAEAIRTTRQQIAEAHGAGGGQGPAQEALEDR